LNSHNPEDGVLEPDFEHNIKQTILVPCGIDFARHFVFVIPLSNSSGMGAESSKIDGYNSLLSEGLQFLASGIRFALPRSSVLAWFLLLLFTFYNSKRSTYHDWISYRILFLQSRLKTPVRSKGIWKLEKRAV